VFSSATIRVIRWGALLCLLGGLALLAQTGYDYIVEPLIEEPSEETIPGVASSARDTEDDEAIMSMWVVGSLTLLGVCGGFVGLHLRQAPGFKYGRRRGIVGVLAACIGFKPRH